MPVKPMTGTFIKFETRGFHPQSGKRHVQRKVVDRCTDFDVLNMRTDQGSEEEVLDHVSKRLGIERKRLRLTVNSQYAQYQIRRLEEVEF